jgi:hypothetical protein
MWWRGRQRGDGGRDIFETDLDRRAWLERLEETCGSHGWRVHAYVLMANHFHILPSYGRRKVPEWLETQRVLKAFELSDDRRGGRAYASYLEARVKDREAALNDAALAELRRGWYPGPGSFGEKVARALKAGAGAGRTTNRRPCVCSASVRRCSSCRPARPRLPGTTAGSRRRRCSPPSLGGAPACATAGWPSAWP